MNTPNRIIDLLNRNPQTIRELAAALCISRNSVHQQVSKLEAAGIIEKLHPSEPTGAGKPAFQYRTAVGKEDSYSSAYKPLLDVMMQTLSQELPAEKRLQVYEKTGRMLANAAGLYPSDDLSADIQKSIESVNSLGAMAEISCEGEENYIRCYSCPVATLVHSDPMTCQLVAAFFSEATGRQVSVHCSRERTVICGFRVAATL